MNTKIKNFITKNWIYLLVFLLVSVSLSSFFIAKNIAEVEVSKSYQSIIKSIYTEKQIVIDSLKKKNVRLEKQISLLDKQGNIVTKEIVYLKQKRNEITTTKNKAVNDVDTFGSADIIKFFTNQSTNGNRK